MDPPVPQNTSVSRNVHDTYKKALEISSIPWILKCAMRSWIEDRLHIHPEEDNRFRGPVELEFTPLHEFVKRTTVMDCLKLACNKVHTMHSNAFSLESVNFVLQQFDVQSTAKDGKYQQKVHSPVEGFDSGLLLFWKTRIYELLESLLPPFESVIDFRFLIQGAIATLISRYFVQRYILMCLLQ